MYVACYSCGYSSRKPPGQLSSRSGPVLLLNSSKVRMRWAGTRACIPCIPPLPRVSWEALGLRRSAAGSSHLEGRPPQSASAALAPGPFWSKCAHAHGTHTHRLHQIRRMKRYELPAKTFTIFTSN